MQAWGWSGQDVQTSPILWVASVDIFLHYRSNIGEL
jgi:hypothetical protein